ncbi:hypothetical protein G6O67_000768 [Ophiocordyceps sinensis]|uniref:Uncharacterized protein n=1 Tax=Ophiocordyceps sinensis TaxID=72228 RepID=A0A8H4PZQ1_9HYPO|nr:hypothetical protein G6O67_000768 [Ophiocordyceps sinensis]
MPALVDSAARVSASQQQQSPGTALALALAARQNSLPPPRPSEAIIPATYGSLYDSPPPGTVVAIVIGSVAGFLLLVLLVYAALGFGPARSESESVGPAPSRSVFSLGSRSRSHLGPDRRHKRRRSRRRSRRHAPETVEVRTREHYVVDGGTASRQPIRVVVAAPRPAPAPRPPPAVVAHDDDDDEVVVIEEHSPPPRKSRRHSGRSRRSDEEARRGAYRDVETGRFAGRGAPLRHVRREESGRDSPGPEG